MPWKTKYIVAVYNQTNCKQFFFFAYQANRAIHLVLLDFISEYTDDVLQNASGTAGTSLGVACGSVGVGFQSSWF